MVNYPSVAILLAAYNGEKYIQEQVDSLFNQVDVDIQLFISVDVSIDSTYEWCKRLENNYSNVTVLECNERFGGAAKNFFRLIKEVDFSGFDYIAFSDQDDVWLPKKLRYAIDIIEAKEVEAFSSDVLAFWRNGREVRIRKSFPQKKYDYYFEAAGPGCTYVLKAGALRKFKHFLIENWISINLVALHDWMVYAYFRSQGMKWFIDDELLVRYRQHEFNQVGCNSGFKAFSRRVRMVKDRWYRTEVEKIINLVAPDDFGKLTASRWLLAKNFWQLRRRPRDACVLLIMSIFRLF